MAAESNGLNLSLGLTLTQRSPPHTHGATANAERPAARRRLPTRDLQSWLRGEPARPAEGKTSPRVFFTPVNKPRLRVCLPSVKKRDFYLEGVRGAPT